MLDKRKVTYTCKRDSEFIARLVDNLLIPMAKNKDGLDTEFLKQLEDDYDHLLDELNPEWIYGFVEQYIAFKLFGQDRLLKNYLKEPKVKRRSPREKNFLEAMLFKPWRFAFMQIEEDLGDDFYKMRNALTDEMLLLFSPGVSKIEEEGENSLYFSLLAFNGQCHQTYGPIIPYLGIQPFDLLYFAGQLDDTITEYSKVEEKLQKDPLPFILLVTAARFPLTYNKKDLMVLSLSELDIGPLDLEQWKSAFKIQEEEGVYQLNLKRWWSMPHFANCHYAPQEEKFVATAATDRGWNKLVETVNELGVDLDYKAQAYATVAGSIATERVLGKKGTQSPYADLFVSETSEEDEEELNKLNDFLNLLMPYLNAEEDYDLQELAEQSGLSYEEANTIAEQIKKKFM